MEFSLKPVFVGWLALLSQVPAQLFMTLWGALFFGGFTSMAFSTRSWLPFAVIGSLFFFGIPLATYVGKKLNYARTLYKFSPDRLEFEEGFFSVNRKVILLKDVREVTLSKGLFQRTCGLGSIYLSTLATGSTGTGNGFAAFGFGNVSGSGIIVLDIADPDAAYESIQKLVEAARTAV